MERRHPTAVPIGHPGAQLSGAPLAERGSGLIELLTGTLFLSILMAISYSFARAAFMSARVQEVKSEAQEVTVMAADVLVRELRMAGFSAAAQPVSAILAAAPDRVEVATDLNGDGDTDDSNERVEYSYDAVKHELMRATGGGSPQPLVPNVPLGGLQLSFFDAAGVELAAPTAGMSVDQCRRIHRIDVLLHVELPNPDPRATLPLQETVSSSVCLRNQ